MTDSNTVIGASPYQREFAFTRADFEFVRDHIYSYSGIVLADHKTDMVYGRLSRRLRELGLNSFAQYRQYISENDDELTLFANALTTNLTHFFRENHHFEYLSNTLVPLWRSTKHSAGRHGLHTDRRVRIWSAGCSSGEEPYSIAMALLASWPDIAAWDVKILATDLDTQMLARAQAGQYEWERVKDLPGPRLQRFFLRDGTGQQFKIKDQVKQLIRFKQLNLMDDWPMRGAFDLIFCRNVVIYFDKVTQGRLFNRFAQQLGENGHLFLGHSESLGAQQSQFDMIGRTMFRKREP